MLFFSFSRDLRVGTASGGRREYRVDAGEVDGEVHEPVVACGPFVERTPRDDGDGAPSHRVESCVEHRKRCSYSEPK